MFFLQKSSCDFNEIFKIFLFLFQCAFCLFFLTHNTPENFFGEKKLCGFLINQTESASSRGMPEMTSPEFLNSN